MPRRRRLRLGVRRRRHAVRARRRGAVGLLLRDLLLDALDLLLQRAALDHLVAQIVDEVHRRQRLLRVERGAVVRAARTLGARVLVHERLARELLDLADAPVVLVLEVELGHDAALPEVAEEDVRQRAEDVDVLRVRHVVEERQAEADVRSTRSTSDAVRAVSTGIAREPAGHHRRHRPLFTDRARRHHVEAVEEEVGDHEAGDRRQDDAGVERHRDEPRLDHEAAEEAVADGHEHDEVEDVDRPLERVKNHRWQKAERQPRQPVEPQLERAERDDEEAPEDAEVVQRREAEPRLVHRLLHDLPLDQPVQDNRPQPLWESIHRNAFGGRPT